MSTGFYWDERCFWHGGGNYAGILPVGGLVQPMASGGLPESPETKRRLKNLIDVTGLARDLDLRAAPPATWDDLRRVHPESYLAEFKALSEAGGGELGRRTPFGPGGFEIAALSAGLALQALRDVLDGDLSNAYALSRPPGHHCLPDFPNGFCLLANIAIAIRAVQSEGRATRVAVLDWDVHHGNGTEAIFYDDAEVLTVSIHQARNYPTDTGDGADRGRGAGEGFNLNIPLPPGTGHTGYLAAMDRLALPAIRNFRPNVIVVACGYDAAANDPLGRMLATAETFREMTRRTRVVADEVCGGRLVLVHEGGYSETYVPFCGHAVLEALSDSAVTAPDPLAEVMTARQPDARFDAYLDGVLADLAATL
ncbi:class II histone deacetylase [Salipiger sp. IMCC34102]|uniref:class II histone deacetylase n=1 Tax=Salipiger sp. IMCC34102 TaxID=2510647 RepID=UPI00101D9B12|nr:class II histone deacetylase [Salipiger sp. IMCC34102]RYH01904.1 class II histone deacetylase [Salipiger sp. IMCC34102]